MYNKLLLFSSFLLALTGSVKAQQDMLLTHFMYNKMGVNPGSTGLDDGFCATTAYRNQWDKVAGAPNSAILNLEGNMNRFFPGGLGINFYHDAIGFGRQNNLMLNYSYPLAIGQDILGIGIGVGMQNFGVKPTWVTPDQSSTLDPSINYVAFSSTGLDLNFGLYYESMKRFYVGISSTHVTASNLSNKNALGQPAQQHQIVRHYYILGGYKTNPIGPGYVDAQMMLKTDAVKMSLDLNGRYIIPSKGYAGLSYRTSDAVSLMLGFNPLPDFTVGYSYDLTLNKLSSVSRGSHEILLKYCYYLPIPPISVTRHPRWL